MIKKSRCFVITAVFIINLYKKAPALSAGALII